MKNANDQSLFPAKLCITCPALSPLLVVTDLLLLGTAVWKKDHTGQLKCGHNVQSNIFTIL